MKLFLTYLRLELKRMLRGIPAIILGMLVFLLVFLGISFLGTSRIRKDNNKFNVINIALVGCEDDKYINLAINTVQSMDTVKSSFKFIKTTEEEATQGLEEKRYNMMFIFPENYIQGFMNGENKRVVIRYGNGNPTITSYVITRMTSFMSTIMVESEKNIYSMQDYYYDMNLQDEEEAVNALNLKYFGTILGRENIYAEEQVNATDDLPLYTYYFCDGIVVLFLLAGLQCAGVLQRRDKTIEKKLRVAGLGTHKSMLARLVALVTTFGCIYVMIAIPAVIANNVLGKKGIILVSGSTLEIVMSLAKASIILIPACMLILFVYELVNDRAMGVFSLFILIVTLGMCSGFFYPITFMPKFIRDISGFTVTRTMFDYVSCCVTGTASFRYFAFMTIHTLLLFLITVLVKNYQLRRES